MSSDGDKYLGIYLNDHLAGSTAGLELARRARGASEGTELGAFLDRLVREIEEEREVLQAIMAEIGAGRDTIKVTLAWAAEKAGRLKLNGHLTSRSPLSGLVELEGLAIGVEGKTRLWRVLRALADPRLSKFDLEGLRIQAEEQIDELEGHRLAVGLAVFITGS